MVQTRYYDPTWMGQWRDDDNSYVGGGSPVRTGGSQGYNSYFGFPSQLRTDINSSSIPVTIRFSLYVTDEAEFDFGAHKTTSNPASGGLPWYEYIGVHPVLSTGRQKVDITSAFKNRLMNEGFEGIVLYGAIGQNFGSAYGLTGDAYRAVIEVDGQWNNPPSAPTITYPNGGETLSGQVTLKANPATDTEEPQSKLRYQWAIWDGTWHYLPLTDPGVTDLKVDFSQYKEMSTAKVGLRAFDSSIDYTHGNYGPWDYSNGVFSIRKNVAPTSPTDLTPNGGTPVDRTQISEFHWQHNDDGFQSRFEFNWRLRGNATWNVITQDSVNEYYLANANQFPEGTIEWRVRTYDQQQLVSPWSEIAIFTSAPPTDRPTIIRPINGETVVVANPVLEWSSIDQQEFNYQVLSGTTVLYEVDRINSNKAETIGYDFDNNMDYTIRLRIKSISGLWSDWASVDIHTSFTTPPMPIITADTNNERGSVTINISNPYPSDTEPAVKTNALYRRKAGTEEWTQIAGIIPVNSTFTDYTLAPKQEYEYKVTASGSNGTTSESIPISVIIEIDNVIISVITNPDQYVVLKWNPEKKFTHEIDVTTSKFQGRTYPLAEFGTGESLPMSMSFALRSWDELQSLLDVVQSRQTLVYRDARGRKEFIVIPSVEVTDRTVDSYDVSFSPIRVYYKEDSSV